MVYACSTHHQTGDTDSFQLVISLTIQLNRQGTFVPCEARIVWYSAGRTSSRQLRDTTPLSGMLPTTRYSKPRGNTTISASPRYWRNSSQGLLRRSQNCWHITTWKQG